MTVGVTTVDKRRCRRYACDATLSYYPFTSRKVPALTAHVRDCGQGGLGFRSIRALRPGQTICLLVRFGAEATGTRCRAAERLKSFALAEVRWCREHRGDAQGYRIGVRYL
jgi:hypothetical protein